MRRRIRRERLRRAIYRYLRIFGQPRGQHLSGFGNLVRQDIPDAADEEILRVLRRMYWTGRVTLSKFARCGPFFYVLGRLIQGGLFYGYDEWDDGEDFFRGEFIVGLA
jgi:hypothetical protein